MRSSSTKVNKSRRIESSQGRGTRLRLLWGISPGPTSLPSDSIPSSGWTDHRVLTLFSDRFPDNPPKTENRYKIVPNRCTISSGRIPGKCAAGKRRMPFAPWRSNIPYCDLTFFILVLSFPVPFLFQALSDPVFYLVSSNYSEFHYGMKRMMGIPTQWRVWHVHRRDFARYKMERMERRRSYKGTVLCGIASGSILLLILPES